MLRIRVAYSSTANKSILADNISTLIAKVNNVNRCTVPTSRHEIFHTLTKTENKKIAFHVKFNTIYEKATFASRTTDKNMRLKCTEMNEKTFVTRDAFSFKVGDACTPRRMRRNGSVRNGVFYNASVVSADGLFSATIGTDV